jgi:hypothetical protein
LSHRWPIGSGSASRERLYPALPVGCLGRGERKATDTGFMRLEVDPK